MLGPQAGVADGELLEGDVQARPVLIPDEVEQARHLGGRQVMAVDFGNEHLLHRACGRAGHDQNFQQVHDAVGAASREQPPDQRVDRREEPDRTHQPGQDSPARSPRGSAAMSGARSGSR